MNIPGFVLKRYALRHNRMIVAMSDFIVAYAGRSWSCQHNNRNDAINI